MQYRLIRGKRKTIAISLDRDGNLIVKAPSWVRKAEIDAFVERKAEWIENTRFKLLCQREDELSSRLNLENGDRLYYLGEEKTLTVIREQRIRAKVKCAMDRILLFVPYDADYDYKREQLEKWYRKEAAEIFREKAAAYARLLSVEFRDIHIKDQRSRWGSCSSAGNLNLNWRLLMAPEPVCDYVIIHELCHLVHMDHSQAFWTLVESICPDHQQYRNWLKEKGGSLYIF